MTSPASKLRTGSAIVVRRAIGMDVPAIVALAEASGTAAQWSSAAVITYCVPDRLENATQAKAIFVACARQSARLAAGPQDAFGPCVCIVGFAAFSAVTASGPAECALENMAVAEAWKRHGIGARLLAVGILWCRAQFGAGLWLEVRASNRTAIAFYERAGFTIAGRRPSYYTQPTEDAILMRNDWNSS